MVALLTKRAAESASVNQELGYAKKAGKRIIVLVEEGANVGVLIQGIERIPFTIDKIREALDRVIRYVRSKAKEKRQSELFWLGALLALLIFAVPAIFYWLVKRSRKSSP